MSLLRELASEECKLEMTPMIDVTFLLLIFFMCTIKFKTLEGKLEAHLPKDAGPGPTAQPALESLEVRVEVVAPGRKVDAAAFAAGRTEAWDGVSEFMLLDHVVRYRLGRETYAVDEDGRAALVDRIRAARAVQPDRKLVLAPLRGTTQGDVVELLDELAIAGLTEVSIAPPAGTR